MNDAALPLVTSLDALAPTAYEAYAAVLGMVAEEGGDWKIGPAAELPLGGFQITATRAHADEPPPASDDELAALEAAAVGTRPNSAARGRLEMAIHGRWRAATLRGIARENARAAAVVAHEIAAARAM